MPLDRSAGAGSYFAPICLEILCLANLRTLFVAHVEYALSACKQVYSKEICELIKTTLGAAHVWEAMEPTVRNMTKSRGFPQSFNGLDPASGYVTEVHCDRNAVSAEDLFVASMADYPELQQYGRGRFVYIIAWRNISDTPIGNDNLAVCDETSLVKPDDYIISDLFTPSGHSVRRYHLNCRNSKQHRWYYFPQV